MHSLYPHSWIGFFLPIGLITAGTAMTERFVIVLVTAVVVVLIALISTRSNVFSITSCCIDPIEAATAVPAVPNRLSSTFPLT